MTLPRDTRDIIRVKKISHATYETPDLEGQIAYYTDVLGLTLNAKEKDAAFLASTAAVSGADSAIAGNHRP